MRMIYAYQPQLMRRALLSLLLSAIICAIAISPLFADDKRLKIEWQSVVGAAAYSVQIKDALGKLVLEQKVEKPYIEFSLKPGGYTLRIGAINKFDKLSSWSDWESIKIEEEKIDRTIDICGPYPALRIGAGWRMTQPLAPWSSLLDFSLAGADVNLGFFYTYGLLRHIGIEMDAVYFYHQGTAIPTAKMNNILVGANLFLRTDFSIPVNLIIRGGGGYAFSNLEYVNVFSGQLDTYWNYVPYYKIGAALEVKYYRNLYIEAGMDYSEIFFPGNTLRSFHYFARAGIEIDFRKNAPASIDSDARAFAKRMGLKAETEEGGVIKCESGSVFKIGIGMPFMQTLPLWDAYYPVSFLGAMVNMSLSGKHGVFKYAGFEVESSYSYYFGQTPDVNFNQVFLGGGVFFRTSFNFPLNAIARGGGGVVFSILHQPSAFGGQVKDTVSYDPYWKVGLALEYQFYKMLYLEVGADYTSVIYMNNPFSSIRYFFLFGVKL